MLNNIITSMNPRAKEVQDFYIHSLTSHFNERYLLQFQQQLQ